MRLSGLMNGTTKKKFNLVSADVAGGMSVQDACSKRGMFPRTFKKYSKIAGGRGMPKVVHIAPTSSSGNVIAFYGSAREIAELARGLL